jgi:hypothetical protein
MGQQRHSLASFAVASVMLVGCSHPARLMQVEIFAVPWGQESRPARSVEDLLADADTHLVVRQRDELQQIEQGIKALHPVPPGTRPKTAGFGVNIAVRAKFDDGRAVVLGAPASCDWFEDGAGQYYEFDGRLFNLLISDFSEEARTEIVSFTRCRQALPWARSPERGDARAR